MTTATKEPGEYPGGQYNLTPLVLVDQQTAALQMDASGNVKVAIASGGVDQDVNLVGINGVAPVTGSGTATAALRVELPTNGTGVVGLNAGTALVGKVGIDQTTMGVTNGVTFAPTAVAGAGIAAVVSTALETGHVLKSSAGNLYGLGVVTTTAAGYVQIFNATTVPAAGAVTPVFAAYVGAFGFVGLNFNPPLALSTGISVAFSASTTPFTKTDSATALISGQVV